MTLEKTNLKLKPIKQVPIRVEKDLQRFSELHLEEIFNLKFISTEFEIANYRIDSVGFDEKTRSFVIIEYKKEINEGVLSQVEVYYKLFLKHTDLIVETYNKLFNTEYSKDYFNFENTNIIIIAPGFTRFQIELSKDEDCGFELWKVAMFNNDTISYKQLNKEKIEKTFQMYSKTNSRINDEKSKYSERHLLKNKSHHVKSLYKMLRDTIFNNYNNIEAIIQKSQIIFNLKEERLITCIVQKDMLSIRINMEKGSLKDINNLTVDVSNWTTGYGDYLIKIKNKHDLDYFMDLFELTYEKKLDKK